LTDTYQIILLIIPPSGEASSLAAASASVTAILIPSLGLNSGDMIERAR
jgi:hypothetical protein